jgi:HAD superfamily hydrolase (TIGR01490 family)
VHLSVFDLDHTLINVNSSFRYYFYLYKKKIFSPDSIFEVIIFYLRYKYLKMSPKQLHQKVFEKFVQYKNIVDFSKNVDEFWEKNISDFIYPPAMEALKKAKEKNHYILLLTNSPNFLIQGILKYLNVNECCASQYRVNNENKITSIISIMEGKEKAIYTKKVATKLNVEKEDITAYSDSIWDLPLLNAVGRVVVVNPDFRLKILAKKKGWKKI